MNFFKALSLLLFIAQVSILWGQGTSPTYSITPKKGVEGQVISLKLSASNGVFNCQSSFPLKEVKINRNTITLRYIHENPGGPCILLLDPYNSPDPIFELPKLKAGKYLVSRNLTYKCLQEPPYCRIAETIELVDTLVIYSETDYSGDFWYFNPTQVKENTPFTLSLLNPKMGDCNDIFSNQSISYDKKNISLSFVAHKTKRLCIVDNHPHGPQFEMKGLAKGDYNVFATNLPSCAVCAPKADPCIICDIAVAPLYVGTLHSGSFVSALNHSQIDWHKMLLSIKGNQILIEDLPFSQFQGEVYLTNIRGEKINAKVNFNEGERKVELTHQVTSSGSYRVVFETNKGSILISIPVQLTR